MKTNNTINLGSLSGGGVKETPLETSIDAY